MLKETNERPAAGSILETLRVAHHRLREELLMARLREELGERLGLEPSQIGMRDNLMDLGMDSLKAIEFKSTFESELGLRLSSTLLFDHPDIESLVGFLLEAVGLPTEDPATSQTRPGMSPP
jgi:myxalamid-type polyketide synthase MxaB